MATATSQSLVGKIDLSNSLAANISTLQRKDELVESIVGHASHVTVYAFNTSTQKWERKGMEGSLFVVQRSSPPSYAIMILNRLGFDHMWQALTASFKVKRMEDYLMFRCDDPCYFGDTPSPPGHLHGIWFHNAEERARVRTLLERIVQGYRATTTTSAPTAAGEVPCLGPEEGKGSHGRGLDEGASAGARPSTAATPPPLQPPPRQGEGGSRGGSGLGGWGEQSASSLLQVQQQREATAGWGVRRGGHRSPEAQRLKPPSNPAYPGSSRHDRSQQQQEKPPPPPPPPPLPVSMPALSAAAQAAAREATLLLTPSLLLSVSAGDGGGGRGGEEGAAEGDDVRRGLGISSLDLGPAQLTPPEAEGRQALPSSQAAADRSLQPLPAGEQQQGSGQVAQQGAAVSAGEGGTVGGHASNGGVGGPRGVARKGHSETQGEDQRRGHAMGPDQRTGQGGQAGPGLRLGLGQDQLQRQGPVAGTGAGAGAGQGIIGSKHHEKEQGPGQGAKQPALEGCEGDGPGNNANHAWMQGEVGWEGVGRQGREGDRNRDKDNKDRAGAGARKLMDKKALQQTLLSLMEDDRFIDMLHARYIAQMRRRFSTR